jgi:hypothetical protein
LLAHDSSIGLIFRAFFDCYDFSLFDGLRSLRHLSVSDNTGLGCVPLSDHARKILSCHTGPDTLCSISSVYQEYSSGYPQSERESERDSESESESKSESESGSGSEREAGKEGDRKRGRGQRGRQTQHGSHGQARQLPLADAFSRMRSIRDRLLKKKRPSV